MKKFANDDEAAEWLLKESEKIMPTKKLLVAKKTATPKVPRVESELEKEFKTVLKSNLEDIQAQLDLAERSLQEAVRLADEYGIPFNSPLSFVDQTYVPDQYRVKYGKLGAIWTEKLLDVGAWKLDN